MVDREQKRITVAACARLWSCREETVLAYIRRKQLVRGADRLIDYDEAFEVRKAALMAVAGEEASPQPAANAAIFGEEPQQDAFELQRESDRVEALKLRQLEAKVVGMERRNAPRLLAEAAQTTRAIAAQSLSHFADDLVALVEISGASEIRNVARRAVEQVLWELDRDLAALRQGA